MKATIEIDQLPAILTAAMLATTAEASFVGDALKAREARHWRHAGEHAESAAWLNARIDARLDARIDARRKAEDALRRKRFREFPAEHWQEGALGAAVLLLAKLGHSVRKQRKANKILTNQERERRWTKQNES